MCCTHIHRSLPFRSIALEVFVFFFDNLHFDFAGCRVTLVPVQFTGSVILRWASPLGSFVEIVPLHLEGSDAIRPLVLIKAARPSQSVVSTPNHVPDNHPARP